MNGSVVSAAAIKFRERVESAGLWIGNVWDHAVAHYWLVVYRAAFGLFIKVFPRPKLADEDKNRVATVVGDFFAIGILYNASEFLVFINRWSYAGIQAYCLYIATLLLIRYHAVAGRLRFAAILYCGSVTYFYLTQTADFGYFEHLQATNFLLVVAFATLALGAVAGAIVLAAVLLLFRGLYYLSTTGALTPLSVLLPNVASPVRGEWRMISENLVEIFLFCWLVRAHIYSQLKQSLVREKEEAINAGLAREQVDKAERQKTQYLVHVNHELRNPLTAIVTSVDMLSKEYARDLAQGADAGAMSVERVGYLISNIQTTSRHVLSMLNDVLEMERLEGDDFSAVAEAFSVRKLVQEVAEIYSPTAGACGNTLNTRVASGLADVWYGPVSRCRQVLLNLVSNALKHAPGSNVVISVSQCPQGVVFEVSDDGPGLSIHAKEHLFEPFTASLGATGSTGLGLRICKLLVEKHLHGSIAVTSAVGKGTVCTVTVPLQLDDSVEKEWEYVPPVAPLEGLNSIVEDHDSVRRLAGKSLLMIDDDSGNRTIIAMALEDLGMKVVGSPSSQEALAVLADSSFDLTLLDHNLGPDSEYNGIELAEMIVNGNAGVIVGYTGNLSTEVEAAWLDAGVRSIVRKPAPITMLAGILASALVS